MDNVYIRELIDKLEHTEIWESTDKVYDNYDEGILALINKFSSHKKNHTQLFFIGNGGSSAIASHMTADFMKNGVMNTCSLYDHAVMTCMGNDYGYEFIFSRQIELLARPGDLLVAISSSGNSPNIIQAIRSARRNETQVITLTGFLPDNKAKQMGDINVYVPSKRYGIVESIHNLILQQVVDCIMEKDRTAEGSVITVNNSK